MKILKYTTIVILIVGIITGLYFLNKYLKNENRFIYNTGTEKRAVLNATWNMSLKEVERANNGDFKDAISFSFIEHGPDGLLNSNRIMAKKVEGVNLWTNDVTLTYTFFDNRLFRYEFTGTVTDMANFDSIAVNSLEPIYGKIIRDTTPEGTKYTKDSVISKNIFAGTFSKDSIFVRYSQWNSDYDKNKEHRFQIEVTYLPIFNEIKNVANKEQKSLFQ